MASTTALETVQDYITDARVLMQDAVVPYRYDDASLLTGLNLALLEARRLRPDLFLGDLTTTRLDNVQFFNVVDTTAVEMEPPFRLAILSGLVAHALLRDQEDIQDERTLQMMTFFNGVLIGKAVTFPVQRG